MNRNNGILLSSVSLLIIGYFRPRQCFAGLGALGPRVTNLVITSTSAVSEPRTTFTATTSFSRFLDNTAFGTYRIDGRRYDCWCLNIDIGVKTRTGNSHNLVNKNVIISYEHCTYVCTLGPHQTSCEQRLCYRHLHNA